MLTRAAARLQHAVGIDCGEAQRRKQGGEQAGEDGDGQRRSKHRPVHVNVGAALQGLDEERTHQIKHERSQQDARGGSKQSQQQSLGKHLTEQPAATRANGYAHDHLAFALDSARH